MQLHLSKGLRDAALALCPRAELGMRTVKAKHGQSLTPNVVMKRTQSQENEELHNGNQRCKRGSGRQSHFYFPYAF